MEEWPPIWRVAENILNKQSRTTDKGLSSSVGVGRGGNSSSPGKSIRLRNITRYHGDELSGPIKCGEFLE
jgi:hypothetical protein